ncbi:syntaxin-binding protein 5 isoform X4 [Drosophila bipectinata]|uniref:syntaxin-binding protein 5 isoform X4 n=1 Tax=Drosophila bipectinata TaxID=42026 RepID=UPI0038B3DFB8
MPYAILSHSAKIPGPATQEPYAIAVLLQYDLVLIDLLTPGFPCFESPYPMDLHESPVTCCTYLTDCPSDLVPAFYSVGRTTTSKKSCFSEREWPISGGEWSPASCSYSEIVITGHQDGSLKFWDSGAGTLQILYKLKTAKMFEKPRQHVAHSHPESDNPLAVHLIFLCSESRRLCVAGAMGQVMLFKFRKVESTSEVLVLEIPILYENFDDIYGTSPECDFLTGHQVQKTESSDSDKTTECSLKVRFGAQRKPPGFQSQLVCLTTGPNRRNVQVTSLCISSSYGLMAYGTEYGLVIIDIIQKICLLSVACPDLYGAHDPYSRTPKSPKRIENKEEQSRSPSSDQLNDTTSPDSPSLEFVPEAVDMAESSAAPTGPAAGPSTTSRPVSPDPVINSARETLLSGSAASTAAATAAAMMAAKSPLREDAAGAAQAPQDRRKSMSWKTFNLKRQLSKVNMKIGGLNVNNDLESLKNSSIFYTPKEASPDGATPPQLDDTEAVAEETTEELAEGAGGGSGSMAGAASPSPAVRGKFRSSTTDSPDAEAAAAGSSSSTTTTTKRVDFEPQAEVERPNNLPLTEATPMPAPQKPARQKFKEKTRDQRLLSVPNIKYQPRDLRGGVRILKNDVSPQMGGGGGAGIGGGVPPVGGGNSSTSKKIHKLDGTFSRSRSSSMSSIDMSSSESVTCLAFIESYAKRNDILALVPTLWIGTSFGSILTLFITMPERDVRKSQPVLITINGGPVVRLKGSITSMSFLDSYGSIIPYTFETWRDENKDKKDRTPTKSSSRTSPTFTPTTANTISNTSVAGGSAGGASAGGAGAGGGATGGASAGGGVGGGSATGGPSAGGAAGATPIGGGSSSGIGGGGGGMSSSSASSSGISGSVSTGLETLTDRQYIVIASEKQTKVFDVANQCCINRIQLSEMDFAVKAETITMKDGSCLATYLSNGHLMVHSLPSLKLLLDTDFLPLMDLSFQTKCKQGIVDPMLSIWGQQIIVHEDTNQISKIFCFSHKGHGLYMASPTEIQKFTISSEFCQFILEMMGELYTVQEMPEQPKEGFFKGLFGGGAKLLDREELFGEQSGKANRSVARHIPGPNLEQLGQRASTAASEISRAHQLAMERGEKLNLLEERAERMANTAQDFSGTAHQLMLKYKDKKWYQL